jgi:hypothetical protein
LRLDLCGLFSGPAVLRPLRFPQLARPPHGWREIVWEILIVTVGVFIALVVQQWSENRGRKNDLRVAEQQMLLEMRDDNLPQAFARVAMASCLDDQLDAIAHGADSAVSRAEIHRLVGEFEPPVRTWDSDAYDAALSSGALTHEGPQALMRWATIYRVLPIMRTAGVQEDQLIGDLAILRDDRLPLTVDERSGLVRTANRLHRENRNMSTIGQLVIGLSKTAGVEMRGAQKAAILKDLRSAYGSCVRDPDALPTLREEQELSLPEQEKLNLRKAI